MKKSNLLFILLFGSILFSSITLNAQFDPPNLTFLDGLEENWKYISYDSNFVKYPYDASAASPYWGRFPIDFLIKNDYIVISEVCYAQSPYSGFTGSLVHKLNYKTGELEWIDYNNMYVGLDTFEGYGGYLEVNNNDEMELMGLRSFMKIEKDNYGDIFYGRPIRRVVDFNTGELLETKIGTDTTEKRAGVYAIGFWTVKNSKGQIFRIAHRVTFPDGIIHENLDFHLIDDDLNIVYPPYDSIVHNSGLQSHEYSLSYPVTILGKSNDTLFVNFGTKNPEDAKYSPAELTLNLIYFGDKDSIHIVKSVDMVDDLYFPQYVERIRTTQINDGIVFTQRIISNEPDVPSRRFIWLSWYDQKGARRAKIDYLSIDGHYYIDHVKPLFSKDGNLYIVARRKTDTNDTTYHDIIKVYPGENNYEKINTISIVHDTNLDIYIDKSILLPNDQVFMKFWINKELGYIATNFVYFYNFNLKDLGIKTNNVEIVKENNDPDIFPNPANNFITIRHKNSQAKYLEIMDQLGRIVQKAEILRQKEQYLDISGLSDGLYYIRTIDKTGKIVKSGKFVKNKL